MPQQIDNLEIQLIANSTKATNALDNFTQALSKLSGVVGSVQNIGGLQDIANGISAIGNAMQSIKGMRGDSLNALTNALNTISNANSAGLNSTADGIFNLTASLDLFNSGAIGETTAKLGEFATAIKSFGLSSAEKAITNIPQLTTAISQMVNALSTLPEVKQNTIDAVMALSKFAEQGSKVGSSVNSLRKSLKGLGADLKTTKSRFSSLGKIAGSIQAIIGAYYNLTTIPKRLVGALWSKTESSMDYIETYNYFRVALSKIEKQFGETYSNAGEESADAFQKSYLGELKKLNQKMTGYSLGDNGELFNTDSVGLGLNPERMMNFQAQIMGITNSVGLLGDASIDTAKNLSMLASDLSSLTNQDIETVMGNLQSGLIGQSRALYKYGIDITSATLAQTALANGITKSVSEMSQSEKMQLRMLAILDQSKIAWGDQANTINSVANQYRIFKEQISNFGRVLGNLFLPIITKVLPVVNALVVSLQKLFSALGVRIFGDNWLSNLNKQINGGVSAEIDDLGDGLDEASGKAKKLKNSLLGIDELNVLDKKDDSTGNGLGVGGIDLSGAISSATEDYESVWNKALENSQNKIQEYVDKITKLFEPLEKPLSNLFDQIDRFNENVGEGLQFIYENILKPLGEWTISEVIPEFLEALAEDLELLNTIWEKVEPWVEKWWDKLGKYTFNLELDSLLDFVKDFGKPFKAIKEFIDDPSWETFKKALDEIFNLAFDLQHPIEALAGKKINNLLHPDPEKAPEWWVNLTDEINEFLGKPVEGKVIVGVGLNPVSDEEIDGTFGDSFHEKVLLKVGELGGKIGTFFDESLPKFWEEHVSSKFTRERFNQLGNKIQEHINNLWNRFKTWWDNSTLVRWWNENVTPFFSANIFDRLYAIIFGHVLLAWTKLVLWWKDTAIYKWWNENVVPWFDKDRWSFDGIKEGLSSAWQTAIDAVKEIWNHFADWINDNIKFSVPSIEVFGKQFGGQTFSMNVPKFANGGFVEDGLFMANHGELVGGFANGRTAVANNDQIIAGIRNGVRDANVTEEALLREQNQLLRQLLAKDTSVHIGDREIAKANNRGQKQLGRTLVIS